MNTLPFLLLLAITTTSRGEEGCVRCPPQDQVLPHPTDCTAYVSCEAGIAHFLRCPPGHGFDAHALACTTLHDSQCVEQPGRRELVSCPRAGGFQYKDEIPSTRDSGSLSTSGSCSQSCSSYAHFAPSPNVHSVCAGEASTCLDDHLLRGVRVEDEWLLIYQHNSLRSQLALGLEDGSAVGHNLPTAANMNAMTWNGELAKVAQALADTCSEYPDCEQCRLITSRSYSVGQNAWREWVTSADRPDFSVVVQEWYNQVESVQDEAWLSSYTNPDGVVINSFTQVAWAETYEVGCGWTAAARGSWVSHFFICNYGPGGNIEGAPVYQFGKPASGCSGGASPSQPGLCLPPKDTDPCEL